MSKNVRKATLLSNRKSYILSSSVSLLPETDQAVSELNRIINANDARVQTKAPGCARHVVPPLVSNVVSRKANQRAQSQSYDPGPSCLACQLTRAKHVRRQIQSSERVLRFNRVVPQFTFTSVSAVFKKESELCPDSTCAHWIYRHVVSAGLVPIYFLSFTPSLHLLQCS